MELTPWFPGRIKPVRKGVYMLMDGHGSEAGFQYWNGKKWSVWSETADRAHAQRAFVAADGFQNDKWRGLTKPAK